MSDHFTILRSVNFDVITKYLGKEKSMTISSEAGIEWQHDPRFWMKTVLQTTWLSILMLKKFPNRCYLLKLFGTTPRAFLLDHSPEHDFKHVFLPFSKYLSRFLTCHRQRTGDFCWLKSVATLQKENVTQINRIIR